MASAPPLPYLGYSFPILKRSHGFWTPFFGRTTIEASILMILGTHFGERVHLPSFGSRLWELIFEQEDTVLTSMVKAYVIDSLRAYEPRIEVIDAEVALFSTVNQVQITVKYIFRDATAASQESVASFRFSRETGAVV